MSFTLALLTPGHGDVVFCSEGRHLALLVGETEVREDNTFVVEEAFLKTLALGPDLCMSVGGYVDSIRAVLERLLPDLPWDKCAANESPTNFVDGIALKRQTPLLDLSLVQCCLHVRCILEDLDHGKGILPVIGGRVGDDAALAFATYREGRYGIETADIAYGDATGFKPSSDCLSTGDVVRRVVTVENLERRSPESLLLEVVEEVADHSFSCNKNITFRRLSQGFVKEGREIVNN